MTVPEADRSVAVAGIGHVSVGRFRLRRTECAECACEKHTGIGCTTVGRPDRPRRRCSDAALGLSVSVEFVRHGWARLPGIPDCTARSSSRTEIDRWI